MEEKNRIFIATFFENKDENLSNIIKELHARPLSHVRIVPEEKLHITWKFLGDIEAYNNEKIFE